MKQVKIANKIIGDGQPAFVIAEMAWSHDGSLEKAKAIVKGTSDAGADAISIHVTSMKDYMVKAYGAAAGQTLSAGKEQEIVYDYLNRINLNNSDWKELFAYARSLGLAICAMTNDIKSLRLCEKLKPDAYVIATACFVEENLVSEIAKQKKPVILRIGGATLGEIENTINLINRLGTGDIMLLHGIQLYPTRIEDTHLRLIPALKEIFGLPVGLADHIDAESSLALVIPMAALGSGANAIEKHITHDRSLHGEDIEAALNPDEFKTFVNYIRETEKSLGVSHFRTFSAAELKYRAVSRKRTVASRPIKRGQKLTQEDIIFKRADSGIYPDESRFIVGRTAGEDIEKDSSITWDKVE